MKYILFLAVFVTSLYMVAHVSATQAVANYKASCELMSNRDETVFWRECDTRFDRF